MNTTTSNWVRRLAGVTTLLMVSMSFVGQASARILFQDDTVGDFESDQLNIGSNDAGAVNTSIKFGADGTASENGVINWNITTNTFEVDHTTAITGGLSATGQVDFSTATGFRMRETANPAAENCATVGELVLNTADSKIYACTVIGTPGTWTSTSSSTSDFEAVYTTDAGKDLVTGNGIFTIDTGTNDFVVNSNDWNVTAAGALDAATITSNGLLTGSAGATISGAATSINASSNFATNINTGTSTGLVSIGGGSGTAAIDTTSWDISSAGVASGFTGVTSTGTVNFSGASAFRMREDADPATNSACATVGELILDTTDNQIQICTVTGIAGAATWVGTGAGTLDGLDSTQFLRSDTSDNFTSGTLTFDNGTTLTANGVVNIGDGGDAVAINSNTWDISSAGVASGLTGITSAGGAVSLNNNSNFNVDLATGTSTGTVSIGGGAGSVAIDTTTWDVTAAGAASGFTTITGSGDITTTGGDLVIGAIGLNDVGVSNVTSGASLVGAFDEFDNSASTTVQGVLNDLDALIGSNAPNVEILTFYPEYPDTVVFPDGATNAGTLSSLYDNTNDEHYYHWTSNNGTTQDMDLKFRFPLPADFVATGDFTFRFRTGSAVEADNDVEITVYNATNETAGDPTACGSDLSNVSAAAWATGTITAATLNAGCTGATALNAGDIIEVDVKVMDNSGAPDFADVGYVSLAYTN